MTGMRLVESPGVWTGASSGGKEGFCFDLTEQHLDILDEVLKRLREKQPETQNIGPNDIDLGPMQAEIRTIANDLHRGRGLVVVRGLPVHRYSVSDFERIFWCFGTQFGSPVSQSVLGDRLGHVIDVTDKDPHARAYRNNRELTLHTDLGDVVSFCCVRKARKGGESWFASALAVHNRMLQAHPKRLERLYRGYRWFRSGEHAEDSEPLTPHRVPVLSECDGWVSCRYVRDYILEAGVHETGEPLADEDLAALDCFDDISHGEGFPVKFTLEPGEAVFINNLTVLHARTKFESHPDADNKRLLLRLWMTSHEARPTLPTLKIFDGVGEQGIPPQAGRAPSYAGRSGAQSMPASAQR